MGYLIGPCGRLRHVPQLDIIARDCLDAGVTLFWGVPPQKRRGVAYLWEREIILAWQLFYQTGFELRSAITHELAHIVTGKCSDVRAQEWQRQRYDALLLPVWSGWQTVG